MKKYLIPLSVMAFVGIAVTSCAGASNAKKPLIFFNRQPSNTDTGEIDMTSMNHNDSTYYVGFDAAAGGTVQGKMITDYLKTQNKADLDRDGDGYLGYVLFVGDEGHNDSKARTLGIRTALGTVNTAKSTKAGTDQTVEGSVTVKDGTLKVKEIESAAMTGTDGSTWNADAAGKAFATWAAKDKTAIDMVVSNNDGMAMGALTSTAGSSFFKPTTGKAVPLFGYDANSDALAEIKNGHFTGTVSQNVDAQAEGTLEMIRNLCDGVTGAASYTKGFTEADQYGNKINLTGSWVIKTDTKAILAPNVAVTASNIDSYYSATSTPRDAGIKDITAKAKQKKVFIDLYNGSDNFLSTAYRPALNYYAPLMNISLKWVDGDGQSEDKIVNQMVNLGNYDAYAINMVKTNSGALYTAKLK
jgi:methyl-galactoside transport system substrate-binding protein